MKNQQRPTARSTSSGETLLIHSTFLTIQGEGPYAGTPAFFVRLAGCNLQCPLCDTEYTDGAKERRAFDVATEAYESGAAVVVITGGEPFRQDIHPLMWELWHLGLPFQIESNGKLPASDRALSMLRNTISAAAMLVISPKTATLDPNLALVAHSYKYVVKAGDVAEDGLPVHALDHPVPAGKTIARPPAGWEGSIYVQPADESFNGTVDSTFTNALNMTQAVNSVMMAPKTRKLCIQMHKYAMLP